MTERRFIDCEVCSTTVEVIPVTASRRYCPPCSTVVRRERRRRDAARRRRRSKHAPGTAPGSVRSREEMREETDREWESTASLIEEGLDRGLTPERVAEDCGVKLSSLLRRCQRRGDWGLHDRLKRNGATWGRGPERSAKKALDAAA